MMSPVSSVPTANVDWKSNSSCGLSDEGRLLALIIHTQASRRDCAVADVNLSFEEIAKLRDEVLRAIEQAREARADEGFWSDLADFLGGDVAAIAGAIAAVAAVIATGGAAAAVLAVIASAASFAAQHAEELGIPAELAIGIAIIATVAGLACGNGQALFKVSADVASTANRVKVVAQVTAGVATGAGAGSKAVAGQYAADALEYRALAVSAEGKQVLVQDDIEQALDLMRSSLDRALSATRMTSDVMQSSAASESFIVENFAGAA